MVILNPDFRGMAEVVVPANAEGLCGWAPDAVNATQAQAREDRAFGRLQDDMPLAMRARPAVAPSPAMAAKWDAFQVSKGRQPGGNDMSLLDEFIHGKPLIWTPQIIGSCVWSNTFRAYVARQMYEIVLNGDPEEYLGRSEFGPKNYGSYGPWSYGMARRRANMRGGDGLYCEPMAESLLKDGVLPCNTPALGRLLGTLRANGDRDYPEPQSAAVYRRFGKWEFLDDLKPYADYQCLEVPRVTSGDILWDLLMAGKPSFVCSMEAIHATGTHRDGFPIHARNPRDQWAHNMAFHGGFTASDGERFVRQSNESWGAQHIYNRRLSEIDESFKRGRLTSAAIGEIRGPASAPPLVA